MQKIKCPNHFDFYVCERSFLTHLPYLISQTIFQIASPFGADKFVFEGGKKKMVDFREQYGM